MILINRVLGHCDDAFWADICEAMAQRGALEMLTLETVQLQRRQFRARTDKGTVVGVTASEDVENGLSKRLRRGSVVFYEEDQRVVLAQIGGARVLVVASLNDFSGEDALALGHYFGCLKWAIAIRQNPTHLEIFIDCTSDEEEMEAVMQDCPLLNISWTFRDRRADDPLLKN